MNKRHNTQETANVSVVRPGVMLTSIATEQGFPKHFHATFGIGVMLGGGHSSASRQGEIEAIAGSVITHHPYEVHDGRPIGDGGRSWRMLQMDIDFVRDIDEAMPKVLEHVAPVIRSIALFRYIASRLDLLAADIAWRQQDWAANPDDAASERVMLLLGALVEHTAGQVMDESSARQAEPPRGIARVIERLRDAPSYPTSLADLANIAQLDKFELVRQFRRYTGLPPIAWSLQLRLSEANRLIQCGHELAQVAAELGFSDQSHLTRTFRRQFGFTPGLLKRASREDWIARKIVLEQHRG